MVAFLAELELCEYIPQIRTDKIDGSTLLECSKEDLVELGLRGVHAGRLVASFRKAVEDFPSARSHRSVLSQSVGGGSGSGGERVGEYEVLRVLGEGGFGTVVLARHAGTGEEVTIKQVVVPDLGAASKANEEAMQLARLEHPQLVKMHAVFIENHTLGRYTLNIAMEYCAGGDLAAHLRRSHPLGEAEVTRLLAQVLRPLQARPPPRPTANLLHSTQREPRARHPLPPTPHPPMRSTSTTRASPIATSSHRTCCSPPTARSSSPTLGSRARWTR